MSNNNIQKVYIRFFNDREVRAVWDETLSVIKLMFSTPTASCPRVSLGLCYALLGLQPVLEPHAKLQ